MNSGTPNPRLAGVRRTSAAVPQDGAPRTVVAVAPVEYFAVAFRDENGRLQKAVMLRVDGKWYMPPGSIEWTAGLKMAAPFIQEEAERLAGKRIEAPFDPNSLPPKDEVDVLDQDQGQGQGEDQGLGGEEGDANQTSP